MNGREEPDTMETLPSLQDELTDAQLHQVADGLVDEVYQVYEGLRAGMLFTMAFMGFYGAKEDPWG
jgi:hypothetical protein